MSRDTTLCSAWDARPAAVGPIREQDPRLDARQQNPTRYGRNVAGAPHARPTIRRRTVPRMNPTPDPPAAALLRDAREVRAQLSAALIRLDDAAHAMLVFHEAGHPPALLDIERARTAVATLEALTRGTITPWQ